MGVNPAKRRIYGSRRWRNVRRRVLARDGWRCAQCGNAGRLEVHHVQPLWQSAADPFDPAGLRTLCRACHFANHGKNVGRPTVEGRRAWREFLK